MIKCVVTEDFSLREFAKLTNIVRKARNVEGKLFVGDTFECDEEMAEYLTGKNPLNKVVVNVIEVKEAKVVEEVEQEAEEETEQEETAEAEEPKKTTKKKTAKK